MLRIATVLTAVVVLVPVCGVGQETQEYRAPRMSDGQPDLRGVWQALNTAVWDLEDHSAELGVPAGQSVVVGGEIPYLPAALAERQETL